MVPGLIQHCVNEVEVRGYNTVGLYRVPGQEKEVKELKERFLKGKGIPNLNKYDIHAVCGCTKDFLRSLQEPLIGRWFWRDFTLASDISDRTQREAEIHRIINDLPPSNQDTLAFVILHLQRWQYDITICVYQKLGKNNSNVCFSVLELRKWLLWKCQFPIWLKCLAQQLLVIQVSISFYITSAGLYVTCSILLRLGPDIDATTMLKETKKQQAVLETLLNMQQEFWTKFLYRQDERPYSASQSGTYTRAKGKTLAVPYCTPQSSAHSASRARESGRKIYFTDDSPKETPRTRYVFNIWRQRETRDKLLLNVLLFPQAKTQLFWHGRVNRC